MPALYIGAMTINDPEYLIHCQWMSHALQLAQAAGDAGEIPVGAVVVNTDGEVIGVQPLGRLCRAGARFHG